MSRLPPDSQILQDLLLFHAQQFPAVDLSTLTAVRWIRKVGYRLSFSSIPPADCDQVASAFFSKVAASSAPLPTRCFQVKSSVFFRHIPLKRADGTASTADDYLVQLKADSHWADISLMGPPRLYSPKSSVDFGILYIDFVDDTKCTTLKRVTSAPVSIGTGFQKPSEVSSMQPLSPRCSICQRWGHPAGLC